MKSTKQLSFRSLCVQSMQRSWTGISVLSLSRLLRYNWTELRFQFSSVQFCCLYMPWQMRCMRLVYLRKERTASRRGLTRCALSTGPAGKASASLTCPLSPSSSYAYVNYWLLGKLSIETPGQWVFVIVGQTHKKIHPKLNPIFVSCSTNNEKFLNFRPVNFQIFG